MSLLIIDLLNRKKKHFFVYKLQIAFRTSLQLQRGTENYQINKSKEKLKKKNRKNDD